jgi:phosphoenolpyruvate carboxylase
MGKSGTDLESYARIIGRRRLRNPNGRFTMIDEVISGGGCHGSCVDAGDFALPDADLPAPTLRIFQMMSPAADDALRDEVRLLGGILGDIIRDEGGQALFDHVEAVRQASIAYHRDPASHPAKRLEKLLTAMSVDQAAGLAHGFALFSLLANIAEDRAHPSSRPEQVEAGARRRHSRRRAASVWPSRRSTRGRCPRPAGRVADLACPDRPPVRGPAQECHRPHRRHHRPAGRLRQGRRRLFPRPIAEPLRRQIVILWATRLVRTQGLVVQDEIDTVVSFLDRIFLHVAPEQLSAWRRLLDAPDLQPFMRVGTWVGGDRDGNPNVDGTVMAAAFRTQARAVLGFYLEEVHALGAELSLAAELAEVSPELADLADAAHDPSPHRADEPYRRALTGIYARLAATYEARGERLRRVGPRSRPKPIPARTLSRRI